MEMTARGENSSRAGLFQATEHGAKLGGHWCYMALLFLCGVLVRIPFYLASHPIISGDSPGYIRPYVIWFHHVFGNGERTPVYPLFLGFSQVLSGQSLGLLLTLSSAYIAIILQSALNIAGSLLLFHTLRSVQCRLRFALGVSLFLVCIPGICALEMNILNMALSVGLMMLTCSLFLLTMRRVALGQKCRLPAVATSAALAVSVLNRPEMLIFAFVAVIGFAGLLWSVRRSRTLTTSQTAPSVMTAFWMAFPALGTILLWMSIMYVGLGEFRITTLNGWNASRNVYNLFDRVDAEDRAIGEIMSRTYRRQLQQGGQVNLREIMWEAKSEIIFNYARYPIADPNLHHSSLGWEAIRIGHDLLHLVEVPCEATTNGSHVLTDYCWEDIRVKINTGDYLGRVSWKLARENPREWLMNVTSNFFQESFNFLYVDAKPAVEGMNNTSADGRDAILNQWLNRSTNYAVRLTAPLLFAAYLLTWGFVALSLRFLCRPQDKDWLRDATVSVLAFASLGTILGTCVLAGFNRIYNLPHLVVFTLCSAYLLEHWPRLKVSTLHRSR